MANKTLYLVDGSSYLYRAFFVPNLRRLTSSDGHPTGVIYGVSNMIQRMLDEYKPEYMAVVFDAKGKTFRHDMYADYKATRPPMPDELRMQLQPTKDVIKAMGIPLIEVPHVEADDVIGTLAKQAESQGIETLVSTSDKDLAQLVSKHVTLVNTMSDTVMDEVGVFEKFGVRPSQIIDYLALIGDSSDNIPGVNKVGPKTAVKWLDEYKTVDNIINNASDFKGKVGEYLREGIDQLKLSRELVVIKQDCDVNYEMGDFEIGQKDIKSLNEIGQKFNMKRFAELSEDSDQSESKVKVDYACVTDIKDLKNYLKKVEKTGIVAVDLETTSLQPIAADIVGMSLCCEDNQAIYIPMAHNEDTQQLAVNDVLQIVLPVLKTVDVIGQHFKYDLNVLSNYGQKIDSLAFDTMLESYVLDPAANRHDMDTLANIHLNRQTIKYEDVCGKGVKQIAFADVPIKQAVDYAAEDADITWQLHHKLWGDLKEQPQCAVFTEMEMPLVEVLASMEQTGVLIDKAELDKQSQELGEQLIGLEQKAFKSAGKEFNLGSPKQLQQILFEEQGIPVKKKTPGGQPSTAEDVLHDLAADYELPEIILEHRSLSKLKSTYTDKLPLEISPKTGRVHTSYHQAVTSTGRLSSANPNLQNIPIRTEEGRKIRKAFIAEDGWHVVAADYSQIELRIMAHLSQDEQLLKAFKDGIDIHSQTASQVFDVALEAVDSSQRRAAKAINFGLMYGMSAFGLSKQLHVSRKEASGYMKQYFNQFPKVEAFIEGIKEQALEQGYLDTLFGRRLYFPDINNRNARVRAGAERAAINAPMQGTAADIIKKAMLAVYQGIKNADDIKLIMQVHDELVFEVKQESAKQWSKKIKDIMESVVTLDVPLEVEYGIGENWDEAH
ncbi:DNA polymerase I [Marinicella gelatinilytica]|uniref:DNA polymerase I n=1 Tax=Marinicella gelatinilytica TaxID=2996017 RepID=UPI002260BADC|nr:DNA polymerase I [Marinicella gelatinilytica]MCX7545256.1 DNA polymerase I [Marinicella gelatinilytica]